MTNVSRLSQLQDRQAERQTKLNISEIVEEKAAPATFDQVGQELRAHRERKGHEIESAARVLRIRAGQLHAIEDSRYEDLPAKTYAVGFVRSYAEYLGLNPDECVRRFKIEFDAAMAPPEETPATPKRKGKLSFPEVQDQVRLPHGSIFILTGILVLAIWGGWYLSTASERGFETTERVAPPPAVLPSADEAGEILRGETFADVATDTPPAPRGAGLASGTESTGEVAQDPATAQGPSNAEQFVAALVGTSDEPIDPATLPASETEVAAQAVVADDAAEPITGSEADGELALADQGPASREAQVFGMGNHNSRVILRARGDVWVRVESRDGAVLFEENLRRGDSFRVPNVPGAIMATRNAGALEVILDGASLGPAGAVGEVVVERSISPDALGADSP